MSDIRVVIVDDDFAVAQVNRAFVDAQPGFAVVAEAHTGEAALAAIERHRPQLVLLDVYLPDLGGLDVLRRLRAEGDDVEVIAVTAARDLDTVRRARQLGVRHYLVKPFSGASLVERLDDVRRGIAAERAAPRAALDQRGIDRVLGASAGTITARRVALPKGLSPVSLERVAAGLADCPADASAAEIAEALGMSRVSARRYLEHLVATGAAEVAPRYGSAGRPEHRYRMPRR
ncbi:two-component system CitB family response regulator [Agromyces flavus]|uniref:Transcriptional regulatory protein n=1 Tax=Agromyces flavus TaxID=589382 RepID=A0A1H1T1M8_9MICO|nr:response regulator [Agromyces flavus]MCP2369252.1 two-component system CitB family response regulator [Agromyces flavus]GGI48774.1 transcriptional regulatory protein [Agromyces flavus]SDS54140.1 two-component system, CitB family, response regulator [Agromyces flavus]